MALTFFYTFARQLTKSMSKKLNLEEVLLKLSNDDRYALEDLFNYYYPRLYNFSKAFLKLEDGIDDILQEVFVKIWQNRKNIRQSETFNSFIFTITRNLLLNELRSMLNDRKIKEKILERSVAEEYLLGEHLDFNELKTKIDELVMELPEKQRRVFVMSRVEGLGQKEIAMKLEISEKTVEYHISQSIKFIKGKLKGMGLISMLYFYLFL